MKFSRKTIRMLEEKGDIMEKKEALEEAKKRLEREVTKEEYREMLVNARFTPEEIEDIWDEMIMILATEK